MTSSSNNAHREARTAAIEAELEKNRLAKQTALEKERSKSEKLKAQRILMRSIRAGGGGYFETDQGTTLGGSGAIG